MDLAPRGKRLGAALIDAVLLAIPLALGGLDSMPEPLTIVLAFACLALIAAQLALLTRRGQTLGKIWLGLRIVRKDTGKNGGFVTNALLRGVLNGALSAIPAYFLADSLFIFREDRRCLHDFIAGTVVVQDAADDDSA